MKEVEHRDDVLRRLDRLRHALSRCEARTRLIARERPV
jgi:hypothetical protein